MPAFDSRRVSLVGYQIHRRSASQKFRVESRRSVPRLLTFDFLTFDFSTSDREAYHRPFDEFKGKAAGHPRWGKGAQNVFA